jgi:putative heme-binding domain-containing protein
MISSFPPRTPEQEQQALHVPAGFEVQLVAAEPEIQKPMNLAFDDRGRLWVTGTIGYPFPAEEGHAPADTVRILEDLGPDGLARKVTTFAKGLNIPIGVLPLPGGRSGIVYSIPNLERFDDDDGDGRADRRERLFGAFGAKDTHGMVNSLTWGFDGWVYACHGYLNESTIAGTDGASLTLKSGNVLRFRPDGSHAESFTHGQVNPFGLSFDPRGNLYSSDCRTRPLSLLLRGASYRDLLGEGHDDLGVGPEMMSHDHGSTAIDGATWYDADEFPAPYRDTLFIGNVVTNRINHDRVEWRGSSPRAIEQPDFLWSEDNWFRPVDIELGPDGALYVADFYNRIIAHEEVPLSHPGRDRQRGRIWRIIYHGPDSKAPAAPTRDFASADVDTLVAALGDPNLCVRTMASNQLAIRTDRLIDEPLAGLVTAAVDGRSAAHALWVLHRRGHLDDAMLAGAAKASSSVLRIHAMRILAERPRWNRSLTEVVRNSAGDPDALVRRCAAEALGRRKNFADCRALLDLRQSAAADDTHLIHVVRMALRDQLRSPLMWPLLSSLRLDERDQAVLAEVALGLRYPESAGYLFGYMTEYADIPANLPDYLHHVARYGTGPTQAELLAYIRKRSRDDVRLRAGLLRALLYGILQRGATVDDKVREASLELTRCLLDSRRVDEAMLGIDLARSFGLGEVRGWLETMSRSAHYSEQVRAAAMSALFAMNPGQSKVTLAAVLGDLQAPMSLREHAAGLLWSNEYIRPTDDLVKVLPTAPGRLQSSIALLLASRSVGAVALLRAVEDGQASVRLLQDPRIQKRLARHDGTEILQKLKALCNDPANPGHAPVDLSRERLRAFGSAHRVPGQGAHVFERHCAACHRLAGSGGRLGPQLDGIGSRGAERLIEDILDPSRNVPRAFRVIDFALKDGRRLTGLLLRDVGNVLLVANSQGREVLIPKASVEERSASPSSLMPGNFADRIPEADFYNLLAFLLLQRGH